MFMQLPPYSSLTLAAQERTPWPIHQSPLESTGPEDPIDSSVPTCDLLSIPELWVLRPELAPMYQAGECVFGWTEVTGSNDAGFGLG